MKRGSPLFTLTLALLGVLGIAALLIVLGRRDSSSFPSADSYQPSGASAFRDLLRANGYHVVVDRSSTPVLKQGEVAVVFDIKRPPQSLLFQDEEEIKRAAALAEHLAGFVDDGGTLVSLPIAEEFYEASRQTMPKKRELESSDGEKATVTWNGRAQDPYIDDPQRGFSDVWSEEEAGFVRAYHFGSGVELAFADGIVATNRFIDRAENAKVLMDAIATNAPRGATVVFVEAAIGNARELGLMEMIGPWAKAAWMQLLLLGIVIVYTLGKPFGLPISERRRQYGARELLDAMSETLMRGRMVRVALGSARDEARRFITRRFGSETGATRSGQMPEKVERLREKLALVESAIELKPAEDQSVKLVAELDECLRDVEGSARDARIPR